MPVHIWWLNAGVAPPYREYSVALEFQSSNRRQTEILPVDVRKWLPGDAVFDGSVFVSARLDPGEYQLRIALLDPRTSEPAVRLAIKGREADGWYKMGTINITSAARAR